jgi:hypothetical protein
MWATSRFLLPVRRFRHRRCRLLLPLNCVGSGLVAMGQRNQLRGRLVVLRRCEGEANTKIGLATVVPGTRTWQFQTTPEVSSATHQQGFGSRSSLIFWRRNDATIQRRPSPACIETCRRHNEGPVLDQRPGGQGYGSRDINPSIGSRGKPAPARRWGRPDVGRTLHRRRWRPTVATFASAADQGRAAFRRSLSEAPPTLRRVACHGSK